MTRRLRHVNMKTLLRTRRRFVLLLGFMFACLFLIVHEEYPPELYQYLYEHFDAVYYFHKQRPHFSCTVFAGGLGNLLFQYAFSYALAKTKNLTLLIPDIYVEKLQLAFMIPNLTQNVRGAYFCKLQLKYLNKYDVGYHESVMDVPSNTDIHYEGYFQSWMYWYKHEAELRNHIKFRPNIILEAQRLLKDALQKLGKLKSEVILVGIHVRRGDMISSELKTFGYQVANENYLNKAKKYIRDRVRGDLVYVASSNDMDWTKKAIGDSNAVFINGSIPEYDIAALTLCEHFIMTVGSFGWWAGFFSKGIVIYYDKPFRPESPLAKKYAKYYENTYFRPSWIGMS